MARKRKEQSLSVVERIRTLVEAGGTAESIAATLAAEGVTGVSRATIGRRILELRGPRRAGRVRAEDAPSRPVRAPAAAPAPRAGEPRPEPAAPVLEAAPAITVEEPRRAAPPALSSRALPGAGPDEDDDEGSDLCIDEDVPLPSDARDLPEGLSLTALHRVLRKADAAAQRALARGDLPTFGAMGRLVTAASDAIRKATPPARVDPNESPDMVAAAARARETLHKLIDRTIGAADG